MVFSSLTFLCVFLPTVFILYTIIPSLKAKNALLIVASLIFYAYGEPVYILLMTASSIVNYVCALNCADRGRTKSKVFLAAAVIINLGVLAVFKYTGMIVTTLNALTGLKIPVPEIALPIGISFFTFQALSYVIDVYRGTVERQKNYFYVLLYISFFPQLIAGPIVKYRDISEAIVSREQNVTDVALGMRRFICGLCKKVLIANAVGQVADSIFSNGTSALSAFPAWLGAVAYLFQIYYDFSGYSDMAIGLGHMFGFSFKENFIYPYSATNIQDFWRRWHISLSTWFKEYVYIPLGGNRKGTARTVLNRLIVFFLTGLWHGANWTFVVWGLWHGVFLLLEEYIPALKKLPKGINHIYTMLCVTLGFVIFRADNLSYAVSYIAKMFTFNSTGVTSAKELLTPYFIFMLICAVIGCGPIKAIVDRIKTLECHGRLFSVVRAASFATAFLGLVWCVLRLSPGGYNPFIYFRF